MRAHRLKTLAVLGGLALGAASQAMAQAEIYIQRSRPGLTVDVRLHNARRARVAAVAHDIDTLASRIAYGYRRVSFGYSPNAGRADRRLKQLASAADDFHAQVERRRNEPFETRAAYAELQRAFRRAENVMGNTRPPLEVRRDFWRLRGRMAELTDLFENRWRDDDRRRYERWERYEDDDDHRGDRPYGGRNR